MFVVARRTGPLRILSMIRLSQLKDQIGDGKVIMALSGGVDSTVAATLIHRAIGGNLFGILLTMECCARTNFQRC